MIKSVQGLYPSRHDINPSLNEILQNALKGKFYTNQSQWRTPNERGFRIFDTRSDVYRCVQKSLESLGFVFSRWTREIEYINANICTKLFEDTLHIDNEFIICANQMHKNQEIQDDTLLLLIKIKEMVDSLKR